MNHNFHVTAIMTLSRQNYTNKQIMSITGHKSSASLETYQRISPPEKISMGLSLRNSLIGNELVPYTGLKKTQQVPHNANKEHSFLLIQTLKITRLLWT